MWAFAICIPKVLKEKKLGGNFVTFIGRVSNGYMLLF